jgi:SSS family solute:Na+ symporter
MTFTFVFFLAVSLLVAFASRYGHARQAAADFFVASGQFGAILFFFLAVGETYSIASILGFPGGIYAHGTGFVSWFLGYILLSFPVGYFLYPLIWRAGRLHNAVTLPDIFARHFKSRALELTVTITSILCLLPLGVMQFLGLNVVLGEFHLALPRMFLTLLSGGLAFSYIAISGIRAPAFVAVLKDTLMMLTILATGLACIASGSPIRPATVIANHPTPVSDVFSMTTIILQCIGFCVVPQTCMILFTAQSASSLRRAQIAMPLYMVMFPFLTVAALYAVHHDVKPAVPDEVFLAVAKSLLPPWAAGAVMAGAALSALVILTGICLALGPLISRNLVPGLNDRAQQNWAKIVTALYLLLSIVGAAYSRQLMATLNNLFYFGATQAFPGVLAVLIAPRTRAGAVIAGLLAGDAVAIGLYFSGTPLGGCNPGLVGFCINLVLVFGAGRVRKKDLLF